MCNLLEPFQWNSPNGPPDMEKLEHANSKSLFSCGFVTVSTISSRTQADGVCRSTSCSETDKPLFRAVVARVEFEEVDFRVP